MTDSAAETQTVVESGPSGPTAPASSAEPGTRVASSRYLVIEEIARGGMGRVLRAYDPKLQREVALKAVRSDFTTADARARMIREARAMAQVSHPNVVAVFDVEDGDDAQVLLAMEYVEGVTLRQWLKTPRPWAEIVDNFLAAGRGLAAAHAEGLLHRDFKPANVLVGSDARVRVTDFGLARAPASEPSLDDADPSAIMTSSDTLSEQLTEAGVVMGTPRYMAPEQHTGDALSPATDQYAFCVSLWEALAGEPPFSGRSGLGKAKLAGPPAWPKSTGVPGRIVDALRRGLAASPADRHPSMSALLTLLESSTQTTRRGWAAAFGVVASLSVAAMAWHAGRGGAAPCEGARAQLEGIWDDARRDEVTEAFGASELPYAAATWEEIGPRLDGYADDWVQMHTETCEATSVHHTQSDELLDLRMGCLRRAKDKLGASARLLALGDPAVIGRARNLADGLSPLSACADVDALKTGVPAPESSEREVVEQIQAQFEISAAAVAAGKFDRSTEALARARELADSITYEPIETELLLREAITVSSLGDYEGAETKLRDALERGVRWGQWDITRNTLLQLITIVGHHQKRPDEAMGYIHVAQGLIKRTGRLGVMRMQWHSVRAAVFAEKGDLAGSERELRHALRVGIEDLGEDHHDLGVVRSNLGSTLNHLGRRKEAEEQHRAAVDAWLRALGPDHPRVAAGRNNLAASLLYRGEWDEGAEQLTLAIANWNASLGEEHPNVLAAKVSLAAARKFQGRFDEAHALLQEAAAAQTAKFGPEHPAVASVRNNLANLSLAQGDYAAAAAEQRQALRIREATLPADDLAVAASHDNLGMALYGLGELDEAESHFRAGLGTRVAQLGEAHPHVGQSKANLGRLLVARGDHDAALPYLEAAWTIARSEDASPDLRAEAGFGLAQARWATGDRDGARQVAQGAEEAAKNAGPTYEVMGRDIARWRRAHEA